MQIIILLHGRIKHNIEMMCDIDIIIIYFVILQ